MVSQSRIWKRVLITHLILAALLFSAMPVYADFSEAAPTSITGTGFKRYSNGSLSREQGAIS